MALFLGCDVSKTKLDVALVDERSVELWHDQVPNEPEALAAYLLALAGAYPEAELRCVVEATATLHLRLCEVCSTLGIPCLVYNPILTKQQLRASIRGTKTDRTDALMIARLGLRGEGRPYTPEPYRTTKYYARSQQKLSQLAASLKLHEAHLSAVLEEELSAASQEVLQGIQASIGAARKQFVTATAAAAPAGLMTQLRSVPGVGPFIAASLIGEIQDVRRFPSAKALVAYVGLDPKVRRSGHSLNATGRLTKRGSPHLRRSVFIAANVARQHDRNFKALYDRKRAEGKRHTVAVCAVARSLLKVIRAVWLRGTPYVVSLDG